MTRKELLLHLGIIVSISAATTFLFLYGWKLCLSLVLFSVAKFLFITLKKEQMNTEDENK
jgi:membrane protein implicated in regulation of membrane protease activity